MSLPGLLVLAIGIALGSPSAPAQVAPPQVTHPPSSPKTSIPPTDDIGLSLRIYGALNEKRRLPGPPGSDNAAYAVGVSEVVTRCADGSMVITALVIGGQLTPLHTRCPVEKARSPAAEAPTCDANRWNCTTSGSPPAD